MLVPSPLLNRSLTCSFSLRVVCVSEAVSLMATSARHNKCTCRRWVLLNLMDVSMVWAPLGMGQRCGASQTLRRGRQITCHPSRFPRPHVCWPMQQ